MTPRDPSAKPQKGPNVDPRYIVPRRPKWFTSFVDPSARNEGQHRSARCYFINEKEVIRDWVRIRSSTSPRSDCRWLVAHCFCPDSVKMALTRFSPSCHTSRRLGTPTNADTTSSRRRCIRRIVTLRSRIRNQSRAGTRELARKPARTTTRSLSTDATFSMIIDRRLRQL